MRILILAAALLISACASADQASGASEATCRWLHGPSGQAFDDCLRLSYGGDALLDDLLLGAAAGAAAQGYTRRPAAPAFVNTVCVPGIPPAPTVCNSIAQ